MTKNTNKIASNKVLTASVKEEVTNKVLSRATVAFSPGGNRDSSLDIFSFTKEAVLRALEPGN